MRSSCSAIGGAGAGRSAARAGAVWAFLAACAVCASARGEPSLRLADARGEDDQRYRDAVPAPPRAWLPPDVPGPLASRPLDQLWLVSCRGLRGTDREQNYTRLAYWRYVAPSGWVASSRDELLQVGGSASATSIFVPGNGYSGNQTRDLGGIAYRRMVAGVPAETPLRFVIWSWPSDHVNAGPLQDVRVKAARTTLAAWYLARWLDELEPLGEVSIVGCSLGARLVGEALQLRGGGRLGAYHLADSAAVRTPMRVVLVSAAIDNDWLLPDQRLGRALSNVDRLLLINNTSDGMLRWYGWLYGRRNSAAALGYTGLVGVRRLGAERHKVHQIDATSIVGRRHGFMNYFNVPRIVGWMRPYVFTPGDGISSEVAAQPTHDRKKESFVRSPARAANQ